MIKRREFITLLGGAIFAKMLNVSLARACEGFYRLGWLVVRVHSGDVLNLHA
jgi:hypothetical protein